MHALEVLFFHGNQIMIGSTISLTSFITHEVPGMIRLLRLR